MARKKNNDIEKVNKGESIDIDCLKEELNKYIDDKVRKEFTSELERANKRLLREKNIKILSKNIVITLLLLIIVYLVYILNDNNYFDKFFIDNNNNKVINNNKQKNNLDEDKELTLDDLKKQYSYLLDTIYINEDSDYLEDYYNGNLNIQLKNYLTLNNIDNSDLDIEDEYNIISEKAFKNEYDKLFNDEYVSKSFKYNGNNIKYITKLNSYISDDVISSVDTNIKREIVDITIDDGITITTIEGLVLDNKIYNILTNEEIGEYNDNLLDYTDKLNSIKYIFDNNDRLVNIDK